MNGLHHGVSIAATGLVGADGALVAQLRVASHSSLIQQMLVSQGNPARLRGGH